MLSECIACHHGRTVYHSFNISHKHEGNMSKVLNQTYIKSNTMKVYQVNCCLLELDLNLEF